MKKIFIIVLGLISFNVIASKVGYLNIEEIMKSSQYLEEKQKAVEESFEDKDEDLKKQSEQLQKMIDDFSNSQDDLSEKEKQEKSQIIAEKEAELQGDVVQLRNQYNLSMRKEMQIFQEGINEALKEFAKQNKYDLIFYKDIAYASDEVDITQDIIKLLEENGFKSK